MARYPLESLRSLRQHRIEEKMLEQSRAKNYLDQCRIDEQTAHEKLDEYKIWREIEIERRYRDLFGKSVTEPQLNKFKQGLSRIWEEELMLEQKVQEAHMEVGRADEALKAAKDATRQATADKSKLDEHRRIWMAQARAEEERREETELEDFHARKMEF